jgi:hypothetical protein
MKSEKSSDALYKGAIVSESTTEPNIKEVNAKK